MRSSFKVSNFRQPIRPGWQGQPYIRQDTETKFPSDSDRHCRQADYDAAAESAPHSILQRETQPPQSRRLQTIGARHFRAASWDRQAGRDDAAHPSDAIEESGFRAKQAAHNEHRHDRFDNPAAVDTNDCSLQHRARKLAVVDTYGFCVLTTHMGYSMLFISSERVSAKLARPTG